jgi:hypothetical protein
MRRRHGAVLAVVNLDRMERLGGCAACDDRRIRQPQVTTKNDDRWPGLSHAEPPKIRTVQTGCYPKQGIMALRTF